jgi:PAS domain S-box-containing protein
MDEELIEDKFAALRRRSEEILQGQPANLADLSAAAIQALIHNLQVHQIELELQNEELRAAQLEIQAARDRYADLYNFAPVGYFTLDVSGVIGEANMTGASLLGVDRSALMGVPLTRFVVKEDQERYAVYRVQLGQSEGSQTTEVRLVRPGGAEFYALLEGLAVYDGQGKFKQTRLTLSEISERKRAEEQFRLVVEASPQAIILVGQDGKIRLVNTQAEMLFGYAREELIGQVVEMLVPQEFRAVHEHDRKTFLTAPSARPMGAGRDLFGLRKDGSQVPLEIGLNPIDTPAGTWVLASVLDITERKLAETTLWASQEQFRQVVVSISDHIYVTEVTAAWTLKNRYISPNVEVLTGYGPEKFIANWSFWSSLIHPADQGLAAAQLERLRQGQSSEAEYRFIRAGGEIIWVRDSGRVEQEGQATIIYGVVGNITPHKQAEEALRRYVERLRNLHEIDVDIVAARSPAAIAQTTLKRLRRLIPCRQASVTLFDFEMQEAVILAAEVGPDSLVQTGLRQPLEPDWIAALQRGQTLVVEDTLALAQPTPSIKTLLAEGIRSYINVPLIAGDELMGVVNLASDRSGAFNAEPIEIAEEVTRLLAVALQQARLHEQVNSARERLETLSHRLLEAQETERRHIARELHDEIGQNLSMVKIDLQNLQQLPQARSLAAQFDESISIVERALQQARTLSVELRPSLLDDLGLIPALRWYIDRQAQRGGFTARFVAAPLEGRLSPVLETVCYRLVQEALANVVRYAQAGQVEVELQPRQAELCLFIRDDGLGFNVAAALKQALRGTSLGLLSMQERVLLVGGQLKIKSTPRQGTVIQARLPLKYAPPPQFD